ncbi:hypothetical protein PR048_012781 [Dryococelus australis]|uniref:Uncharacterized protein n=1 Tax=Dryococelus australis TaxID=614101 RepID=A0ABQ9HR39_9NEOP|nr:hypothetical protein PR048_012781 [Dryococelus australis]
MPGAWAGCMGKKTCQWVARWRENSDKQVKTCFCMVEELLSSTFSARSFEQERDLIVRCRLTPDTCIVTKVKYKRCAVQKIFKG